MGKKTPPRLSARIRELRTFFGEYDRAGVVLGGVAVDALTERLRGFEIDAADLESGPRPRALSARPMSEIARRYAGTAAEAAR